MYRTSLLLVDYTGAFTGILLFATSRLRTGAAPLSALILVPLMMIVPMLLTIIRAGCEGHVADQQPHYKIYTSTGTLPLCHSVLLQTPNSFSDETVSFDVLPVCFATSYAGPLWSVTYFAAQLLYTSIGPMVIYAYFIYQSFIDEFPAIQNKPNLFFAGLIAFFAVPSVFLYMPVSSLKGFVEDPMYFLRFCQHPCFSLYSPAVSAQILICSCALSLPHCIVG